jgi:alpha-ketoglutarate-dependent taurine dioxygenase
MIAEVKAFGLTSFVYEQELLQLASEFGQAVPVRAGGELVQTLRVQFGSKCNKNSLTRRYGVGSFPYHTDGAYMDQVPRYLVLRSTSSIPSRRPTLIKDFITNLSSHELRVLSTEQWRIDAGRKAFYSSVICANGLRLDLDCMRPVCGDTSSTVAIIQSVLDRVKPTELHWNANRVVVIDNWRLVHARGVGDELDDEVRELERVLVKET